MQRTDARSTPGRQFDRCLGRYKWMRAQPQAMVMRRNIRYLRDVKKVEITGVVKAHRGN